MDNLENYMCEEWKKLLRKEFTKDYFICLKNNLRNYKSIYPPINKIFNFTFFTVFENIKIVIIGQDPYHKSGQAMGLSFSVSENTKLPPSLRNIFKELENDIDGFKKPKHGDLTKWAEQGVLLLNNVLTVSENKPNSHSHLGWKIFTKKILEVINEKLTNVVFMLWGKQAQKKCEFINAKKHLILQAGHPSPFSYRFFEGCKHFSTANLYLKQHKKNEIDWNL